MSNITVFFNQINVVLVSIKDFFQKHTKNDKERERERGRAAKLKIYHIYWVTFTVTALHQCDSFVLCFHVCRKVKSTVCSCVFLCSL